VVCLRDLLVTIRLGFLPAVLGKSSCRFVSGSIPLSFERTMTAGGGQTKIGGEYGEIRSELDVRSLNRWLASNSQVKERVKAPVTVKQFAVSTLVNGTSLYLSYLTVTKYGQVRRFIQ
jgi:hypothetical protein